MKMIKGFETELVRVEKLEKVESEGLVYYVHEVGLGNNEHDALFRFTSFDEVSAYFDAIYALLVCNNVKIIKQF